MSFTLGVISPPAPSTSRGSATRISVTPDGKEIVFTNGRGVFVRGLNSASKAYFGHQKEATVARVSPSGYYCASGDVSGQVRVWDMLGDEQILKLETRVISGRINDLAWDGESKRIIAVGDGKERFGHAFMFDTGSSVGEISGHSKVVNTVAVRRERPYRAVTGSDDGSLVFLHGAPYKFSKTIKSHTTFVHSVDYSPDGNHFASAGADRKIFLYDGKTGDQIGSDMPDGHQGSVFAVSWSPDSKQFASSSADCTVKLWDVESKKATQTLRVGSSTSPEHHQVGNVWAQQHEVVSLSYSGDLNCFDVRSGKLEAVLSGHQKAINALTRSPTTQSLFSGSYDGRVNQFIETTGAGACVPVQGASHTNGIVSLAPSGSQVVSAGMDDSIRYIETNTGSFEYVNGGPFNAGPVANMFCHRSSFASTSKLPTALAVDGNGTAYVGTVDSVQVQAKGGKATSIPANYSPRSIAYHAKRNEVAVGGEDGKIRFHSAEPSLPTVHTLDTGRGSAITALSYSPSGDLLAAGDAQGKIIVYDAVSRDPKITRWVYHTAKVNSIAWTEDGRHATSGSLDGNVYVWSIDRPMRNIAIKGAHPGGVNAVVWDNESRIASAGGDATIRRWEITFHT